VGGSAYCTSKAALLNLTRVLALEWARHGVQVNAIAPGYVETDMNADLRADPDRFARIVRRIPAGRFGRPEEIAALAAFLAGPSADFITGETIVVDGGELARV
jgi:2-deoxy-D-gluconate 3-dehydrogenase